MNFLRRSYEAELIDDPAIPFPEIQQNLRELDLINTWLGGHAISIKGLKRILTQFKGAGDKHWHICEIGCGGGDNLHAIASWCVGHYIHADFTGVDINHHCIEYASRKTYPRPVKFVQSDYRDFNFSSKPDIIFNSLFCHHFPEKEVIQMLGWMKEQSAYGFFINDLHRHPVAYHLIKLITGIFSSSRLVKNDAPLSVSRGFTAAEWKNLLEDAGINNSNISWEWAFRYLIVFCHDHSTKEDAGTW